MSSNSTQCGPAAMVEFDEPEGSSHRSIFLNAAQAALCLKGRPMRVDELTAFALQENILSSSGTTPSYTMRARLSENVRKLAFQSPFQRVGPNRFALRKWDFQNISRPVSKACTQRGCRLHPFVRSAVSSDRIWFHSQLQSLDFLYF